MKRKASRRDLEIYLAFILASLNENIVHSCPFGISRTLNVETQYLKFLLVVLFVSSTTAAEARIEDTSFAI